MQYGERSEELKMIAKSNFHRDMKTQRSMLDRKALSSPVFRHNLRLASSVIHLI